MILVHNFLTMDAYIDGYKYAIMTILNVMNFIEIRFDMMKLFRDL